MAYKNSNYSAFYVCELFDEGFLGTHATTNFVYYNLLRAWMGSNQNFPFNDAHETNYNFKDGRSWELTLQPRIHERLRNSNNIILFSTSLTVSSRALQEEINFAINKLGLPVITVRIP